ncbi:hypothetical protein SLS58_007565 [Diplodia intermedia]|uniref:Uncharacterized protein n=1 Tax=Diplodia intermedia TaxID=856260 RepID=A0ABR3TK35_9PEZI
MFRLFANALREEAPQQPQDEAPPATTTAITTTAATSPPHLAPPEPPRSPRLQVEHSRRLEEELAILRADLADQRGAHEARLADQRAKLTAKLAAQRDKYEARAARLEERNAWLEGTVAKRAEEKQWLERRNDALEATEKRLDARVAALEERVFALQTDNWALRQENADFRADFDGVVGEMAALRRGAEALAERAHRALARPRAKDARGSPKRVGDGAQEADGGEGEGEEGNARQQATPRGRRIEASDASLSGETLTRTGPRSRDEGNGGEGRGRLSQAGGPVPDPRSLEALRTLGASRNVSPSPTPERGRQRRLGGNGAVTANGAGGSTENVAIRHSKKRQRTESDTEA